jgi:hypothetical protein
MTRSVNELARIAANVAARYGNLARVAANFHIQSGNPAELLAAYLYARKAAHFAAQAKE